MGLLEDIGAASSAALRQAFSASLNPFYPFNKRTIETKEGNIQTKSIQSYVGLPDLPTYQDTIKMVLIGGAALVALYIILKKKKYWW